LKQLHFDQPDFPRAHFGVYEHMSPNVVRIRSIQQHGETCGFWAVFNAKALQMLVDAGDNPSSVEIAQLARRFEENINIAEAIDTAQVVVAAEKLGIHLDLLGSYGKLGVLPLDVHVPCDVLPEGLQVADLTLPELLVLMARLCPMYMTHVIDRFCNVYIRGDVAGMLPFVCNTGAGSTRHWILVCIFKAKGYRPTIVILDSGNNGASDEDTMRYVNFVKSFFKTPSLF
jgi:hypothetical protein